MIIRESFLHIRVASQTKKYIAYGVTRMCTYGAVRAANLAEGVILVSKTDKNK